MDYAKIVLAHRILVSLFLVHYIFKLGLLLLGKNETLAKYTAKTKVVEMIISAGFLLTGLYLVLNGPKLVMLQWIKIVMVLASIPIAIVGFKKGQKILAIIAVLLVFLAYGLAEMNKAKNKKLSVDTHAATSSLEAGKMIYAETCAQCHGENGDGTIGGAKRLDESLLTNAEKKEVIKNGKGAMKAYPTLSEEQLDGLVLYIESLKK